ncbi:hypothetical protein [Arthrobacter sp. Soil762]|uniref:hypothetical protein n=1 Tax=Arthrobacter sp. Soil762 TaxID=1736401 RepID=UPI0006FE94FB|nr:hypothetical protein [Arthrobacter sp. Soil762]KRE71706.1 hypothetical protein ASG77_11875 [Arthrobacter sp. Soil762]
MTSDSSSADNEIAFLWATRGKNWGFRFLRTAGRSNPLEIYRAAFFGVEDTPEAFQASEDTIAFRFLDPEKRRDAAGRVIPHEFLLFPPLPSKVSSVEEGFHLVWPLVKDDFARDWEQPQPRTDGS